MSTKQIFQQIFHHFHYGKMRFICFFSTIYCRALFRLYGINLDSGSKFFGIPIIYLFPNSEIIIGCGIDIRTAQTSNLIGLNRKTIIATHGTNAKIVIGNNCGFSAVVLGAKESIIIGDNVILGANALITDFDWHAMNPTDRNNGLSSQSKPIVIGNNVFIGYSTTILKGVTIGENSVIGANSIVTSNIPSNVIAAGNPCRVIRKLTF